MGKAVVAGHICLDVIPEFAAGSYDLGALLKPGSLTEVGDAVVATGGVVPNTGQALHRLGDEVVLMAKIGDDEFGRSVRHILDQAGAGLADGLIVDADSSTSYTLVINPPGIDRVFLHSPGANHTFCADDIDEARLDECELFHFGYPPLMKRIYERDGAELKTMFERMKGRGMATSLDMTFVDPASESGRIDWLAFLKNVLPVTDVFLPSLDEILFMVDREKYNQLVAEFGESLIDGVDAELVEKTAQTLIDLGVPVVVIKLGKDGLYLRTAPTVPGKDASWNHVSRFEAAFSVNKAGTTGAGDCAIAGFLCAYMNGFSAQEAVQMASATGSASVEALDAVGAVPHRKVLQQRIAAGWARDLSKYSEPLSC